jgi:hypothetical protein
MTAPLLDVIFHLYLDVQRSIEGVIECMQGKDAASALQMGKLNGYGERIVVVTRCLPHVTSWSFGGAVEK